MIFLDGVALFIVCLDCLSISLRHDLVVFGTSLLIGDVAVQARRNLFLNSFLKILAEGQDNVGVLAEAGDVNGRVAKNSLELSCTVVEKQLDHIGVALVGGPMQGRHLEFGRLKVDIGTLLDKNFGTLEALSLRVITAVERLSAQEALVGHQVQRRVPLVVRLLNVKRLATFGPFVENPLETSRVAVETCFVDGQIAIIVLGIKDLITLTGINGILEHLVEQIRGLISALGHQAHEHELVMPHFAFTVSETHYFLSLNYTNDSFF